MSGRAINIPTVNGSTRDAIVDRLRRYDRVVEVGIGRRTDVAAALAGTTRVTATDVVDRPVPAGVRFVRDDVADPDPVVYADAGAIYALDLPPELHRPTLAVAREHGAAFGFTTLGTDPPAVPVRPETLPGETWYRARGTGPQPGSSPEA